MVENEDQEEVDERDKKFPEPPAFYKHFTNGPTDMEPPDLSILAKRDYIVLYKLQRPVFLKGSVEEQSEDKALEDNYGIQNNL